MASRLNHVSVSARDLDESADFYAEVVGAKPIASPQFGVEVRWLALGDTQLHLFVRDDAPPPVHHFAVEVDDLEPAYAAAERRDAFDRTTFGNHLIELPGEIVQLYVRDPVGNLMEINFAGASRLSAALRAELKPLGELYPQSDENLSARLFVGG